MSTSPCCAEYKFPPSPVAELRDGFAAVSLASRDAGDYFALPTAPRKKQAAYSTSSLALDATLHNLLAYSVDSNMSSDTLFDEPPKPNRNVLSLLLRQSAPKVPVSYSRVLASAKESSFTLDYKYPLTSVDEADIVSNSSVPRLKKHATLPALHALDSFLTSIKAHQLKRLLLVPQNESHKTAILGLSPRISYLAVPDFAALVLSGAETNPDESPLILDIRPLADYVISHMAGAINVCLPLTLLKRPNFDLRRCVNSLPAFEKFSFQLKMSFDPPIIIYDNSNTSASILHMCKKLIDKSCFLENCKIYLLDGTFDELLKQNPQLAALGKDVNLTLSTPSASSTPILNFQLPTAPPRFKIRHNEEVFSLTGTDDLLMTEISTPKMGLLPEWLRDAVTNSARLRADFNRLEECEKLRLNCAFDLKLRREFNTPGGKMEVTPVISTGLDYGHKNRYKDIFLYEHSRVALCDENQSCSYINASYLRGGTPHQNYIATQGPLPITAGDFWKCVVNHKSQVVISLTRESENGLDKCYPFWNSGTYNSGDSVVEVYLKDQESIGALTFRVFRITCNDEIHHTLQIHLETWEDMSVADSFEEVLSMIRWKKYVLDQMPSLPDFPAVIHCSAGCGRTGVFVATDMLTGWDGVADQDPVYDVVNGLRRQRVLMVQTMRQYMSIYSLLIQDLIGERPTPKECSIVEMFVLLYHTKAGLGRVGSVGSQKTIS